MLFQNAVRIGELVRNRNTRECWLVVQKNTQGLFVVNLYLNQHPALVMMILPAHTDMWDRDVDIDDLDEWEKQVIENKMPLIEEAEKQNDA